MNVIRLLVICAGIASCTDPFIADAGRAYTVVTTGGEHSCAITDSGDAYCWGRGGDGELGTGTKANQATPAKVVGGLQFEHITAGDNHTCALTTTGQAYCWGWNAFFQRGNSTDGRDSEPVPVTTAVRFTSISAGAHHTCALGTDSLSYCWGWNRNGQLGNGTTNTAAPLPVVGGLKFRRITSGAFHSCGLTATGAAHCWGANEFAQLGAMSTALNSNVPLAVRGGLRFQQIDAGRTHTCATALDTQFYCWGSAEHGELGDGSAFKPDLPGSNTPTRVSQNFPRGTAVFAGASHSCAIGPAGATARCWGRGEYGQLANGATNDNFHPQPVTVFRQNLAFSSFGLGGVTHACGIVDRSVYCWGTGHNGELGVQQSTFAPIPQRVQE